MKKPKEGKRQQIIAAAVKIFSQNGYHNTKMEEIAAEAEIGKGTIYEYFSSKISLFQSVIEDGLKYYHAKFDADKMKILPFDEYIKVLMEAHIKFYLANKELTRMLFLEKEAPDKELLEWAIEVHSTRVEIIKERILKSIERREIRSLDPSILSYVIQATIASFCVPIIVEDKSLDPQYYAERYSDIIMNGIRYKEAEMPRGGGV
ncbi:MAG: TetR/AcrR family transcriptional regulator [Syntrophomonadaceae bacterium]|nr:TetR/AcrR family transcriptional regulator [Syntrophomonadaceae bacterium]